LLNHKNKHFELILHLCTVAPEVPVCGADCIVIIQVSIEAVYARGITRSEILAIASGFGGNTGVVDSIAISNA
jgi:hypothetical protein